jgi:hypothetical protein
MVPLYYAAKSNIYTLLQMWVWAYINAMLTLIVNTNNGVESQNKVFKHDYLAEHWNVLYVQYCLIVCVILASFIPYNSEAFKTK